MALRIKDSTGKEILIAGSRPSAQILTFNNINILSTSWSSDTTYSDQGYNFKVAVSLSGVTSNYIPDVTFSMIDALSGNFAPIAETYTGGIYIWAKEQPSQTVSVTSIICTKEG